MAKQNPAEISTGIFKDRVQVKVELMILQTVQKTIAGKFVNCQEMKTKTRMLMIVY